MKALNNLVSAGGFLIGIEALLIGQRFGLNPDPDFVETHPGGGAVGLKLTHYRQLRPLIQKLTAPIRA